jgi:Cu2+-containing amine oxidase
MRFEGIASARVCNLKIAKRRYGTHITKNILAQYHQHFYAMRLHFNVDGENNTVAEYNMRSCTPEEVVSVSARAFRCNEHVLYVLCILAGVNFTLNMCRRRI